MQYDGERKTKYKWWDRLTDVSPSKYLKRSEMCRQPSTCLDVQKEPCKSEGRTVFIGLGSENHVTLNSSAAASRSWPGRKTNRDQRSGHFSLNSTQKTGGSKGSERKNSSLLSKKLFSKTSCPEDSLESVYAQSESLSDEVKQEDSVDGDSSLFLMSHTSKEASSPKTSSHERKRSLSNQVSSALFRRTILDVFGSSLNKRGREGTSSGRDLKTSPETTEVHKPSSERARNVSSSSSKEETQESEQASESNDHTENGGGQCCTPSGGTQPAGTRAQPVYNGGPSTPCLSRLVFLDEGDSDEDDRKVERQPSIGSDFSDVEDLEPLTKFSQDELSPSGCSREDVTSPPSDCIKYVPRLSRRPWTSTPHSGSKTQKQAEPSSHYISKNLGFAAVSSLSKSNDFDTTDEDGCCQSASFNSFRIHKEKRTFQEVELDVSYNTRTSDFFSDDIDQERLPVEPPKWLQEEFIDTHCHLDMLYSKLSFKGTFAKFRQEYDSTFPKEFQGCITDFCNPRFLKNFPWKELLEEDMVWGAFGCHPHFARYYTEGHEQEMLYALRHPKAIAFGEMGLDYSHKCTTDVSTQHKVFERQLKLGVALKKPLVIHCRDADTDLLEIMKNFVPRDYKIHRHCFTGSYNVIEPFLLEFPNMAVGFTALLTYPSAYEAREAVRKIPLERIIVETDAPYFLPRQVPKRTCRFSHPGLALHTVGEIARLKGLPISSVLAVLRQNTKQLYNL
ncbi:3'-5' RNA nuclease TATDN2 [Microcaecilia unicolor]|uniref:Deoxyribonuclease TATDN2 n=1 Tax=Microcaecilia unicolor TaxID=1415580 RepID=A0A6P7YH98_9AMPH|nr:putative deoxyribonuclease TATDN2 [Microcaecilia unicolor]